MQLVFIPEEPTALESHTVACDVHKAIVLTHEKTQLKDPPRLFCEKILANGTSVYNESQLQVFAAMQTWRDVVVLLEGVM